MVTKVGILLNIELGKCTSYRNEIKRRIIAMEPDRYKITTPRKYFGHIIMDGNRFMGIHVKNT